MNIVVAHYDDIDKAKQAMLELSGNGIDEEHIHLQPEEDSSGGVISVNTKEDEFEQVSVILERFEPTELEGPGRTGQAGTDGQGAPTGALPTGEATTSSSAAGAVRPEGVSEVFAQHEPRFREHFRAHAGGAESFDDYREAYLEGTRLGTDFPQRDWSEIEQEGRRRWERNQHPKPWAKMRDYVKHGWGTVQGGDIGKAGAE